MNDFYRNKNILVIVTGSISAYKSATLVREFVKSGAHVRVGMTTAAQKFITVQTLAVLSKHDVLTDLFVMRRLRLLILNGLSGQT